MNDTDSDSEEPLEEDVEDAPNTQIERELSPREKERESRVAVRKELRDQRQVMRDLRQRVKNGENLTDDIEACKGQIDLLYKELQSIEEGGHTTFLAAKEVIAPKMNYSEKKEDLKQQIKDVKKEISLLEDSLYEPNLTDQVRDGIIIEISTLKKDQEDLSEEMNAILQFNHTRFVEAREENKENIIKVQEEQELEADKDSLNRELKAANEVSDLSLANEIITKLADVEAKIKNLNRPKEDVFLDQFTDSTEDPFLER